MTSGACSAKRQRTLCVPVNLKLKWRGSGEASSMNIKTRKWLNLKIMALPLPVAANDKGKKVLGKKTVTTL